jgi:acetylornithine deacetylase/succinyl-diaminopimelate desuccinylase-like protein
MLPQRVVEEIETNRQRYVAELTDFLRIPSVSTDSEYAENTRQSAEWVVNKLKKLGFQTELRETAGHVQNG